MQSEVRNGAGVERAVNEASAMPDRGGRYSTYRR